MVSGMTISWARVKQFASKPCFGDHHNKHHNQQYRSCRNVLLSVLFIAVACLLVAPAQALAQDEFVPGAGVYDSDSEVTYREYWISHEWFTGGDDCAESPVGNKWYIEPLEFDSRCPMFFDINDDFSNAVRAEVYMDIWRGRANPAVRFNLNDGITRQPDVGENWSRTPYVGEIPLSELVTGTNILNLWVRARGQLFHVHDIAIRIYYTSDNPLLNASNGVPREAPQAALVAIEDDNNTISDLTSSNVLTIDNDKLTLTAFAEDDARFIEFHAFYDGYDEDNDGLTLDWHNRTRLNRHPGGKTPRGTGGTIDHIGTVSVGNTGNYSIEWDVSHIPAQSGVKFKVRVVTSPQGTAQNVREAAGGVTAEFELRRVTTNVQTFTIPNFQDGILFHAGLFPETLDREITLPQDLSMYDEAMVIASYWERPFLSINNNPDIASFESNQDDWELSVRDVPISYFQGGTNLLTFKHNRGFGEFIEKPGPMIVLRGPAVIGPMAPSAMNDNYQLLAGNQLLVPAATGVLANDTDANGDALIAQLVNDVSSGILDLSEDGALTYSPNAGFIGTDTFTYLANDGVDSSAEPATVTLSVLPSDSDTDFLVHLEFDDDQDPSRAFDSTLYGNDGLVNGATYVAESGDSSIGSLAFDSSNSVVLAPLDANGTGLTVASWFRAESFPGSARDPRIVSKASGTGANDHIFMLSTIRSGTETFLRARVRVGGVTRTLIADSGSLATDVWYHAALVYDQSTLRLYLNAEEVGSVALSGPVDQDNSLPVVIGSQPLGGGGGRHFDGNIDDVRILQRAYSEVELQAIVDEEQNPGPDENSLPLANNDVYDVIADQPFNIAVAAGVLVNDTDADGDELSAQLVNNVSSGILDLNEDGSFAYTPTGGFSGTDTFTYFANDGEASSEAPATVTLIVEADPVNPVPVAVADDYQASHDTILSVDAQNGVLANDTASDAATVVLVEDVSTGTLMLNTADGSFTYEPVNGVGVVETFSYYIADGQTESAVVDATITVSGPPGTGTDFLVHLEFDDNQDPSRAVDSSLYGNDGVVNGSTYEAESGDSSIGSMAFDSNDSVVLPPLDVNGPGLTVASWFRAESFPGRSRDPRIVSKASGTGANDHIFMLSTIRSGTETFLRARVRVGGVTRTLIADSGSLATDVWYHAALVYDQSTLSLYLNAQQIGSVALSGPVDQDGSLPVVIGSQPVGGGGGRHFDGNIDDVRILQRAYSEVELQTIVDEAQNPGPDVNSLPAANNDAYDVIADQPFNVAVAAGVLVNDTDADGDTLIAQLVNDVSSGILDLNENGSFTYTPTDGFIGTDTFTYFANDGEDSSEAPAAVALIVQADPENPVPAAPTAIDDNYQILTGNQLLVTADVGVLANDSDANGDALSAQLVEDVTSGTLTLSDDGSFSYTPVDNFTGNVTFSYNASDGELNSDVAQVVIEVSDQSIDTDLLARLEFEDIQTPGVAEDSSVSGNFGVVSGAEYNAQTVDGSLYSMDFSGEDTIDLGEFDVAGTGLTLAAWVNVDTFPGSFRDPRIISKASGTAANDHIFMLGTIRSRTETLLRARIRVGGVTTTLIADSGTSLSTGLWYHVAATYDGMMARLYLDGVQVGMAPLSGNVYQDNSLSVAVGSQPGGGKFFDGKIDDVRIMQRALMQDEINSIVNGASTD